MKIFQKFMSFILVIAILCSFAFAANYTDENKITHLEAVNVLTGLGIMEGYPDGSMKPDGDVTRAEMAKLISVIMNNGKDIGSMYSGACVFADAKTHWAAGYIAYCHAEGVIDGRNETTFDPNGKVTVVEATKMVLGALGYNSQNEGFIGTTWAGKVLDVANDTDILKNTDNVASAANATRQIIAQMLVNALEENTVRYVGGSTITVGGITMTTNAKREDTNKTLMAANFPELTKDVETPDAFGRKQATWTYQKEIISQITAKPLYAAATVTGAEIHDIINFKKITPAYIKNGVEQNVTVADKKTEIYGGLGACVEVYDDRIIEVETFVGKVTNYDKTKKLSTIEDLTTAETNTFKAQFAKDAIVLYTANNDGIQSVSLANHFFGEIGGYSAESNGTIEKIYINNEAYSISTHGKVVAPAVGTEYTVYVDNDGNIVYLDGIKVVETYNYAYILDTASDNSTPFMDEVYYVKMVMPDGTTSIVKSDKDYEVLEGKFTTYTITKGKFKFTAVDTITMGTTVTNRIPQIGDAIANNTTIFILETKDGHQVYTGIHNVPTFNAKINYVVKDNIITMLYASAVELDNSSSVSNASLVIYKTGNEKRTIVKYEYYTVKAIVNGIVGEINVSPTVYNTLAIGYNFYSKSTIDDNGVYDSVVEATGKETITSYTAYADGIILVNGTAHYVETVKVYAYDKSDKAISKQDISKVKSGITGYYFMENNNIVEMYIIVD